MALSDPEDVAMRGNQRKEGLISDAPAGQWLVAQVVRLVDGKLHEVVEIDADIDDGSAVRRGRRWQVFGIFYNLCGGMRHRVHTDDAILQVDEDECGLLGSSWSSAMVPLR